LQGEETLSVYLEYVSGGSIHKLLQEYGAFKEPVIQNYTRQIVSGLSYLHARNTVHRYFFILYCIYCLKLVLLDSLSNYLYVFIFTGILKGLTY
jgi:serine/threonine protein kinase